ncbi:MAG TPA: histidine phosphotransferase family protein [Stellaceae bacterium]|nr:histidine phosphotransferase family protein [Stellaceae bacterium]
MAALIELRVLELLNARLCHELVSPVGAINNGVELLDDEDPEFIRDAIKLIGQSARKAGQKLQFYRFAYGTAAAASTGGSGASNGRELTLGLLEGGKVRCDWSPEAAALPVLWQRLACNMVVLASEALPRGGELTVRPLGAAGVEVAASGDSVNVAAELRTALDPAIAVAELTSRSVHAYFAARLAAELGGKLLLAEIGPQRVVLHAAAS